MFWISIVIIIDLNRINDSPSIFYVGVLTILSCTETYRRTSSMMLSLPDISSDVRWGRDVHFLNKSLILNFELVVDKMLWTFWNESSDTSRWTSFVSSKITGTISEVWAALKLYIDKNRNLSLHFLRAEISSIDVTEMSKFSNFGKSSAIISKPCLLNSVRLTFKQDRFRNFESETTTQNLVEFKKVLLQTLRVRKFVKLHSPRHPITSFIVTLRTPVTSRSEILCCFKVRKPLVVNWASRIHTCRKFINLGSNNVIESSVSLLFSHRASNKLSDRWCWKNISWSLNTSFVSPVGSVSSRHRSARLLQMKSMQQSWRLSGESNMASHSTTLSARFARSSIHATGQELSANTKVAAV